MRGKREGDERINHVFIDTDDGASSLSAHCKRKPDKV
jgi:hypothetical protein